MTLTLSLKFNLSNDNLLPDICKLQLGINSGEKFQLMEPYLR